MTNPIRKFIDWVWRTPKDKIATRLKAKCEAMPHKQRLTVVGLLFGILTLTAFLLFGHACYKMGAREQRVQYEIQHMGELPGFIDSEPKWNTELPINDDIPDKMLAYDDTGD